MSFAQHLTGNLLENLTKAGLLALTAVLLTMLVQHQLTTPRNAAASNGVEEKLRQLEQRLAQDTLLYKEVADLAEQRQAAAAMEKLKEVEAAHPDNPRSLLWQACLQYEEGMIVEALASYRQAVDAEPGYVDKKSPFFVGKSIKQKVAESQEKLQREMLLKPSDMTLKKAQDDLLYLKRRLAGGCE